MVDDELVLTGDADAVRTIWLNRPQQLNAFNQALCGALTQALTVAAADDDIHVVVLTGNGRAFSAGTDLLELAETGDFRGTAEDPDRFRRLVDTLARFPKPLVCAVNGIAVGIGATLLGHADLVVMADTARLRCPFTSLALAPEAAASVTFPQLVGRQAAAWMLLSSEWVDADEAKTMGLAWRVVPADALAHEAHALARRFAVHPLDSLLASKRLITDSFAPAVEAGLDREDTAFDLLLPAAASREAVQAFVAGRDRGADDRQGA